METLTRTTRFDLEFLIVENNQTANYVSEITDVIMDSYNYQVKLGNAFRSDMQQMIGGMEFAYPNDPQKLRRVIDRFITLSQASMKECMEKTLDLHGPNHVVTVDVKPKRNNEWMKDMVDQLNILKNDADVMSENEAEFFHYEVLDQ